MVWMTVRSMASDEPVTIGDRLPETFLADLEDVAEGYKTRAALDRPAARGTPPRRSSRRSSRTD